MSGSRELRADWKESERDGGGGKSLSSAGTGAPVPWTGGAVLANIQPSPCSTTSSTHKQRQPLKTLLPYGCTRAFTPHSPSLESRAKQPDDFSGATQNTSVAEAQTRAPLVWRQTLVLHAVAVTHVGPWLCFSSPSRRRPKADPDPWSAGPSTGSCLPIAQNAPSSSCSTSQYPLVRRKYTSISSDLHETLASKSAQSAGEAVSSLSSVDKMED
ncbi:hypothetical protein QQF64_024571 [Cirrhinus molitorella]|uniref:Uncharacterized protein n=1 Tax=Cirrhinus molitorella TaxID=172907 RepID=A0ABR3NMI9_9TELE